MQQSGKTEKQKSKIRIDIKTEGKGTEKAESG